MTEKQPLPLKKEVLLTCKTCGKGVGIVSRGVTLVKRGYALCTKCDPRGQNTLYNFHICVDSLHPDDTLCIKAVIVQNQEPEPPPVFDNTIKTIWEILTDD